MTRSPGNLRLVKKNKKIKNRACCKIFCLLFLVKMFTGSNLVLVDNQQFITTFMPYCFSGLQKPISFMHNTFSLITSWDCLSNCDSIKPMFNGCSSVSHLADKRKRWDTLLLSIDFFLFMVLTYKSLTITLILCVYVESAELIKESYKCNLYWERSFKKLQHFIC